MKTEELQEQLLAKGFDEKAQDTGHLYSKKIGFVDLYCYVEPGINVSFTAVYSWSDNFVKGTYTVEMKELALLKTSVPDLFKETLGDLPPYVGEKDIHAEVSQVIDNLFA